MGAFPEKLLRQRLHINVIFFFKCFFANKMLHLMALLTKANRPSIGWLHAYAAVRPASYVSAFYCLSRSAGRTSKAAYPSPMSWRPFPLIRFFGFCLNPLG
jgi:hypothetical protein